MHGQLEPLTESIPLRVAAAAPSPDDPRIYVPFDPDRMEFAELARNLPATRFRVPGRTRRDGQQCLPEVEQWMEAHLPRGYTWPGNYRKLEQCVRNIVIRRSYTPIQSGKAPGADPFFDAFRARTLTAQEVLSFYATIVYRQTGSYEEAARRLALDRRTVKARVEAYLAASTAAAS